MKKIFCLILVLLVVSQYPVCFAAQEEMCFAFFLTCGEKNEITAAKGDILTFTLRLQRTDGEESYPMYAMQDEIVFDSSCFSFVEDSQLVKENVIFDLKQLRDGSTTIYMNCLSLDGTDLWNSTETVGTFQLQVIGDGGVSNVTNENAQVSDPDGSRSYPVENHNTAVVLSTACTVTFESNGGSAVESQTVQYGEYARRPQTPARQGYTLEGWYSDLDTQNRWDFDTMPVRGNMTLYAAWTQGETAQQERDRGARAVPTYVFPLCAAALFLAGYLINGRKKGDR